MRKKRHLNDRFYLKGLPSILLGIYFLFLAYGVKFILKEFFINDDSFSLLSPQSIKIVFFVLFVFFVLISSLTLFITKKKSTEKFQIKLWYKTNKKTIWKYFTGILFIFSILTILMGLGFVNYIAPTFLTLYGIFLFLFKNKKGKNLSFLAIISIVLGLFCFLIPTYWYYFFSFLGIVHTTYGIIRN